MELCQDTYLCPVPLRSCSPRPSVLRCQFPYYVRSRWHPLLSAPGGEAGVPVTARASRDCQVDTRYPRGAWARYIDSGRINPEWESRSATRDPRDDSERARNTLRQVSPLQIRLSRLSFSIHETFASNSRESISHLFSKLPLGQ